MQTTLKLLPKMSLCAFFAAGAPLAFAQSTAVSNAPAAAPIDESETVKLDEFVVTGVRASLASAQEIKRDKVEIVDSIVADDINKLPDFNVTDALQRITGIQINRDRGEGAGVAIRGLTQMETTLNGREVFTAGSGRNLDFADIPSEMIAGINVYKTSSAEHIEGGVGGLIDMRTRRPFDFKGREIVVSGRVIHGDLVDRTKPQISTLLSDRWETKGGGEIGLLINAAYQKRAWREDQKGTGNPIARTDLVAGQTVTVPNGTSETTSLGHRKRTAGTAVLQWRPTKTLELYAEGSYAEFYTIQDSQQINVTPAGTSTGSNVTLFSGTNDVKSVTWANAPFSVLSFARDTVDRTKQAAVGAIWTGDRLTLKADLSYTESFNHLFFSGPFFAGTAASFTQDVGSDLPSTSVSGTDMLNPGNYRYTGLAYRTRPFDGDLSTAQLDGIYALDGAFFKDLRAGVRYAKRGAQNDPGLIFADASVTGITAADKPDQVTVNTYNFYPDESTPSIRSYIMGRLENARDAVALRNSFGITTPLPTTASPLSLWDISEETSAGYLMTTFEADRFPLDGNIGVRVVRTEEKVSGSRSVPATPTTPAAIAPLAIDSSYTEVLPSVNLRYRLTEGLYARASASKTLTRPDFNQLSPSLILTPNPVDPTLNQGSAGNPDLKPIFADNLDFALEKYFNATTSIYATAFFKKVDGFVANASNPEVYDGQTYQVSRPQNSTEADIKGFEVGYQQFYDFLPGWLSGFGLQANYTYVDSETPNSTLGINAPLQNLSKHSYNIIAMYEKKKISARVAYNWRDKFLSGVTNIVNVGRLPVYTRAYGWLDASVTYRFTQNISLALEGTNLLGTMRKSYYSVETRPQSNWINDVQVSATATVRF